MSHPDAALAALRDFFAAGSGAELERACARLATAGCVPPPEADEDLEYDFNRLFVGPGRLAAPPYASVYLETEPRLMGETTLLVRAVYHALGLASPRQSALPDDHLSLELDAALALRAAAGEADGPEMAALRRYFLAEHLGRWLPAFAARVREASPHPAVACAVSRLLDWLDHELSAVPEYGEYGRDERQRRCV